MKRIFAVTGFVALTACSNPIDFRDIIPSNPAPAPTPAVAPAPAPVMLTAKERLLGAIENNNCELNAGNVGAILSEATIGTEELKTLTPQLESEGRITAAGPGVIRATTARCA